METTLTITVQPEAEPVTVRQARDHCRIDHASDDGLLATYIRAARIKAEGFLSRALLTQTLLWTVRPTTALHTETARAGRALRLPRAPVQSVELVSVMDERGNLTPLAPATLPVVPPLPFTGYIADLAVEPCRLRIGADTPLIDGRVLRHTNLEYIQVTMVAGYAEPDDVPANVRNAIMMIVAFLYENRGDAGGDMPKVAEWLLENDRLQFLGG
jgi:uncharacterized phiE125 gp8 family phage protein